ncbi:nucleotide-sugar transporter-domain-containing protein [Mycena alexandri]|uniref:Nucleotide-sugar transporter-domain-containing protein n=1 Tax=Mycena alexandri TaxID=1745969 RepID=A0AAD6SJS6_9AGAR|nr:nucleotide-sugar transporter-domain-containing protein [Mycena alexandri]
MHKRLKPRAPGNPTVCGLPLKYVSLVTLAVQNAALSIVMHYSRVSTPPAQSYSPASAVLLNELLKGLISFFIALARVPSVSQQPWHRMSFSQILGALPYPWTPPFIALCADVLSADCWKLSIPALLYVIQNSLQFVAVSNLPVASFQVTYQLKILTTAAFSVALLRRRLTSSKWVSLLFLALGVGIVQIQSQTTREHAVGSAHDSAPNVMSPLKGFTAVTLACFTSGLAGVYFEMVLKGNNTDLWVRNVQLALFSLVPALLPVVYASNTHSHPFRNFTPSAWATVAIQVLGGLVTAVVIKYSDNIMKGFATSLSIILSFLASVALFDFHITPSFVLGASTVLGATWVYNRPEGGEPLLAIVTIPGQDKKSASGFSNVGKGGSGMSLGLAGLGLGGTTNSSTASGRSTPFPGTPVDARTDPILGHFPSSALHGNGKRDSGSASGSPIPSPRLWAGSGHGSTPDLQLHRSASSASLLASSLSSNSLLGASHSQHNSLLLGAGANPYGGSSSSGNGNGSGSNVASPWGSPYASPYPSRPPSRSVSPLPPPPQQQRSASPLLPPQTQTTTQRISLSGSQGSPPRYTVYPYSSHSHPQNGAGGDGRGRP